MYKFICANINKSRNFTSSYRKLAQTKRIHQDCSRPQTTSATTHLEENADENQEYKDEENVGQENPKQQMPSPSRPQRFPITPKFPTFKTIQSTSSLKIKECPKFCTGNLIVVNPSTPSISKKYYHVYSINPSTTTKRSIGNISYNNFVNDEARENYKRAMDCLYEIEQKKAMSGSSNLGRTLWLKKHKNKKPSKTEISYPTHTAKHHVSLTKRYRIREGSADRKIRELEEKFKARKRLQTKVFRAINARKITYPTLVDHLKKGKCNTIYVCPDNKPRLQEPNQLNSEILTETMRNQADEEERNPRDVFFGEVVRPKEEANSNVEQAFESLIKSHPTIENASKEVKMKLKTKFIQLLVRSARGRSATRTEAPPKENNSQKIEPAVVLDSGNAQENVEPLKRGLDGHEENSPEEAAEIDMPATISHPQMFHNRVHEKDYMAARYPKRVWVDDVSTYDVDAVCVKETASRARSGLITESYAKETPKPNYKNLEEEAQQLSQFLDKFKTLQYKNADLIKKLKRGRETPETTSAKLDRLKRERWQVMKELEKMNVTFSAANTELDSQDHKSVVEKSKNVIEADLSVNKSKTSVVKNKPRVADKLRRLLTGKPSAKEASAVEKIFTEELEISKNIIDAGTSKNVTSIQKFAGRKQTESERVNMKVEKPRKEMASGALKASGADKPRLILEKKSPAFDRIPPFDTPKKGALITKKIDTPVELAPQSSPVTTTNKKTEEPIKIDVINNLVPRKEQLARKTPEIKHLQENVKSEISTNKKTLGEPINKIDIINTLGLRKEQLAKKSAEIKDLQENVKSEVSKVKEPSKSASVLAEKASGDVEGPTPETAEKLSFGPADTLDERSEVDEMNERARDREQAFHRRKKRQEEKKIREEIRDRTQSLPSVRPMPRFDKVIDRLEEKAEIGERSKEKIANIVPAGSQENQPQLRKLAPNIEATDETPLEEPTKCDELNQAAEHLNKKANILFVKDYALDQPDVINEVKTPPGQSNRLREDDVRIEGDMKKQDLEDFSVRKKEINIESNLEMKFCQKAEPSKQNQQCLKESQLKSYGKSQGLKEDIESNAPKHIHSMNAASLSKEKRPETNEGKCDAKEISKQIKREHLGFVAYYGSRTADNKAQLVPIHRKVEPSEGSNSSPSKDHSHLGRISEHAPIKLADNKAGPLKNEAHAPKSASLSETNNHVFPKQTEPLIKAIDTALNKRIVVSPAIQETAPELKKTQYSDDAALSAENFKKQVLNQYLHGRNMTDSEKALYVPKERLVVSNISAVDGNRPGLSEHNKDLIQESSKGEAILRPGDEIVILEKNLARQAEEKKTDLTHAEKEASENAAILNLKLWDEALSLRSELAETQSKVLVDTSSKIDEMMEKIDNLESLLKKHQRASPEEKKSENKPRITPPKPSTEKEKKDIKKDKPKGPNDMVLPPKIRGSKPEKVPRERNEPQSKAVGNDEPKAVVKPQEDPNSSPPVQPKFRSISHQNLTKLKETKKKGDFSKAPQNIVKTETLRKLSANTNNSLTLNENRPTTSHLALLNKNGALRSDIFGEHKISINDLRKRKANDEECSEQLLKHFGVTLDQSEQLVKEDTVKIEIKCSDITTNQKTVDIQKSIIRNKKIVRLPKSRSLMTVNRVNFVKKANDDKLQENNNSKTGIKMEKSATQLVTGGKVMFKTFNGKRVSSPTVSFRAQKADEIDKPKRSSSKERSNSRAASCPPKPRKLGLEDIKTKYSSWSIQGGSGRQTTNYSESVPVLKKGEPKEVACPPPKRSASDASRKGLVPNKPKLIVEVFKLKRLQNKERLSATSLLQIPPKQEKAALQTSQVKLESDKKGDLPQDKLKSSLEQTKERKQEERILQPKLDDKISQQNESLTGQVLADKNVYEQFKSERISNVADNNKGQDHSNSKLNSPLPEIHNIKQHQANSEPDKAIIEGKHIYSKTRTTRNLAVTNLKQGKLISKSQKMDSLLEENSLSQDLRIDQLISDLVNESGLIESITPQIIPLVADGKELPEKEVFDNLKTSNLRHNESIVDPPKSVLTDKDARPEKGSSELEKATPQSLPISEKVEERSSTSSKPIPKVGEDLQEQSVLAEKESKQESPILVADNNVEQKNDTIDSPLAVPKVLWPDKDTPKQPTLSDKTSKQVQPVLELAQVLATADSSGAKQDPKTLGSPQSGPKVSSTDKKRKPLLLPDKAATKQANKKIENPDQIMADPSKVPPPISDKANDIQSLFDKERWPTLKSNISSNDTKAEKEAWSSQSAKDLKTLSELADPKAEKRIAKSSKLGESSHPFLERKRSVQKTSKPKVLRNPKFGGLDNSGNKISKAGISTSPVNNTSNENDAPEPYESKEEDEIGNGGQTGDSDKTAIFRIQYDGEVFIIKKADEVNEKENLDQNSTHVLVDKPTKSFVDMIVRSIEPNVGLKNSASVDIDDSKLNEPDNNERTHPQLRKQSSELRMPKPAAKTSRDHTTKHASSADCLRSENSKPKLVAKIKEIIVKPIKENPTEDGLKEGVRTRSSMRSDSPTKQAKKTKVEKAPEKSDRKEKVREINPKEEEAIEKPMSLDKTYSAMLSKIEKRLADVKSRASTRYDSLTKETKKTKVEKEPERSDLKEKVSEIKPKDERAMEEAMSLDKTYSAMLNKIEKRLEDVKSRASMTYDSLTKETKKTRVEKAPEKWGPKEKAGQLIVKGDQAMEETMAMNKKYSAMLKKIEKRLVAKRKMLEIKTQQIQLVANIIGTSPDVYNTETVDNKRSKSDPLLAEGVEEEEPPMNKQATKSSSLLKRATKPKSYLNLEENKQKAEKARTSSSNDYKSNKTKSDVKIVSSKKDKPQTSMPEFPKNENDDFKLTPKKRTDETNLTSGLPLKKPIKANSNQDNTVDPFKDVPYFGTVMADDTKSQGKSNDLYTLNVPVKNENNTQDDIINKEVTPWKFDNNETTPRKPKSSMYTLEIPKPDDVPRPGNSEADKHNNNLPRVAKARPKSARENIIGKKDSDKTPARSKSEATRYRVLNEIRMHRKKGVTTSSLKKVIENKATVQAKEKTIRPSTSKPKDPLQDANNKAKTEAEVDRVKPSLVSCRRGAGKSITIKLSRERSVEKLVSKENLVSEITTWSSKVCKSVNRKVRSVEDRIRPQDGTRPKTALPKIKKLTLRFEKTDGNSKDNTPANRKPLKTSQSDHVKTLLPKTSTMKNVSIKPETSAIKEETTLDGDINSKPRLNLIVRPDKNVEMSREEQEEANASQARQPVVRMDIMKPPVKFVTKAEEERHRMKEELRHKEKMGRLEKKTRQQELKFKKDMIDDINASADYMLRKEEKRTGKGSRWQQMSPKDDKVIQPSVGRAPWGNKFKKHKPHGKNNIHSAANTTDTPSKEKLISKAEFLRRKRLQAQNEATEKALTDLRDAGYSMQKNLAREYLVETKQEQLDKDKNTPTIGEKLNLKNLGEELEKHVNEMNKLRLMTEPGTSKEQSDSTHAQRSLPKRIEQEIQNTIKTRPDLPLPGLSNETLHFKINEMAKLIAKNMKIDEEEKDVLEKKAPRQAFPEREVGGGKSSIAKLIAKNMKVSEEQKDALLKKATRQNVLDREADKPTDYGKYNRPSAANTTNPPSEEKLMSKSQFLSSAYQARQRAKTLAQNKKALEHNAEIPTRDLNVKAEDVHKVIKTKSLPKTEISEHKDETTMQSSPALNMPDVKANKLKKVGEQKASTSGLLSQLPDTSESPQQAIDEMRRAKSKSKMERRIRVKSQNLKNMLYQPELRSDVEMKSNTHKKPPSQQPSLEATIPTFSLEDMLGTRQREVDKMMEVKRKNKMAKRTNSGNMKNMLNPPPQGEAESSDIVNSKKYPPLQPGLDPRTDKEEIAGKRPKKPSNFKPGSANTSSKRKPTTNTRQMTSKPKGPHASGIRKTYCKKLILPMQKPTIVIDDLLEDYKSTLDKPVGDKIKKVPKQMSEIDEKAKKASPHKMSSDPLAKYRHLKITYMTVTRPVKKDDEKFLPAICRNAEKGEPSEEEHKNIIHFRYELLKRLNDDFRKHLIQQLNSPSPVETTDAEKSPSKTDKQPNVITELEKLDKDDMNKAKICEVVKPALGASLEVGLKNIGNPTPNHGKWKITKGTNGPKYVFDPSKTDDDGDKKGPEGVRRYSTVSDKSGGSDDKDEGSSKQECEKPDVGQVSEGKKERSLVERRQPQNEVINPMPESAENFDITEAVPQAFERSSPFLEEERQKNLYYRYHQMSFLELHGYLDQQRVFSIDAAEKSREKACQNKESNKCPDDKPSNSNECEESDESKQ